VSFCGERVPADNSPTDNPKISTAFSGISAKCPVNKKPDDYHKQGDHRCDKTKSENNSGNRFRGAAHLAPLETDK
jgi:hypothetical protein